MSRLNHWKLLSVVTLFLVMLILPACSNSISAPQRNLQESVHYYIFDQQPVSGAAFVAWANSNLAQYSARKVQKALYSEGKRQAKEGHPNAIAALSLADQAWTEEKGLEYKRDTWAKLQEEAKANVKTSPSGTLQLWPSK